MRIIECDQGSPEWYQARLGRVTSSRVADMMARTKTGWGYERAKYEADLICERQTNEVKHGFKSAAMQWGTNTQPQAEKAYAFRTDNELERVGFIIHDELMFGASPDALVNKDGLAEFKCPETHTHIETLLSQTIPGKYLLQIQWQLYMTERRWCDYVSFDPRMQPSKRLFIRRVHRNESQIQDLVAHAKEFLLGIELKLSRLEAMYPEAA